jgi:hypothetical protein
MLMKSAQSEQPTATSDIDQITSLNVLNFNRMKEELAKMFEVDEIQA